MAKEHAEKTSAADKSIGFDFQYYYFLLRLINLKDEESVGLEVMDDVHTELANSRLILVQVKHTTKVKADGTAENLTKLDEDLWKTFSNWSQVIADIASGRKEKNDQIDFVKKTDFLLISNKLYSEKNSVIKKIIDYHGQIIEIDELDSYLEGLKTETQNENVKKYIQNVLDLDSEVRELFFRNLDFDLGCDDIIDKCKKAIKEKHIDENRIDDVFRSLDSQIRADNFIAVQRKNKIVINFDEFYKKYRRNFDIARNKDLVIRNFEGFMPDRLSEQNFIKQLLDIEDISVDDSESMAKFTKYRLKMQNNIDEWYRNGDLIEGEIDNFNNESKNRWENEFRRVYRSCTDKQLDQKAIELLDTIRKEKLSIASQELPTDMSNGQYYRLSDIPEIGWHRDWDKKYK